METHPSILFCSSGAGSREVFFTKIDLYIDRITAATNGNTLSFNKIFLIKVWSGQRFVELSHGSNKADYWRVVEHGGGTIMIWTCFWRPVITDGAVKHVSTCKLNCVYDERYLSQTQKTPPTTLMLQFKFNCFTAATLDVLSYHPVLKVYVC